MVIDDSDNIYLTGYSDGQAFLTKYTNFGLELWNKTYSGIAGSEAITIDTENNLYLAGVQGNYPNKDIYLLKVNQTGDIQWYEEWGDTNMEYIASIELNSVGDLYVLGSTYSYGVGGSDITLLKYNLSGGFQWNKTWGYQYNDLSYDFCIDSNDNIFVVGVTSLDSNERYDICLIKFDSSGTQLFNTTWGVYDVYDFGYSIIQDSSQDIYISGERSGDLILVKFDSSGNYLWDLAKPITGGESLYMGNSLILDNSENLIVSCLRDSNLGILKYNKTGHLISEYSWSIEMYGQPASTNEEKCLALLIDSSNNFLITGAINPDSGWGPAYLFLMECNSEFGTNIENNMIFSEEKSFFKWYHTYMEYDIISKTYQDRDWKAFADFKIEEYDDYFLIYLFDKGNADHIKLFETNENTQTENSYNIELYKPFNLTYNKNNRYRVYFNYSRTYESCVAWTGIFCDETETKNVSGEYLSDYFTISKPSNITANILGFNMYLLIGLLGLISISIYYNVKKRSKKYTLNL
jgi:hypothetical protein